jgi:oligo-alginate lyase
MTRGMNGWQLLAALVVMCAGVVVWAAAPEAGKGEEAVAWPRELPSRRPFLECTPEELARLREAWKKGGREGAVVAAVVGRAEGALKTTVEFPPRGGQHNQWYQCEKCQLALKTVDAGHHQCPKCGKVYTGEPYDDVLFSKTHDGNMKRARDAAWAYAITGRAEFAADAKAVLLGYAERYSKYPYHDNQRKTGKTGGHIHEQTLNEASMMAMLIVPAVDLLHDDAALSKQEREKINEGLIRPMLENMAKNPAGKSNWQSWHNAALFGGGALLGDEKMMRGSVESRADGFLNQMRVSVSSEGMWYENSWSYHAYTLQALTQHAEFARRCGVDLWKQEAMRKMFVLPGRYTMPGGSLPRFGDAVGASTGVGAENLESAFHVMGDPMLLASLPAVPTFLSVKYGRDVSRRVEAPVLGSEVFADAGHAILRSTGEAGLAAAITFGPYGGFHGHFDKLSFVLFGRGRELGVDPGRALSQAYRLPIHANWYKATVSHNAVVVNGKSQAAAEGKLLAFGADGVRAVAVTQCDKAYEGVRHRRVLAVGPVYALVVDVMEAEKPAVFDWIYHNTGKDVEMAGVAGDGKVEALAGLVGQEYVRWTGGGKVDGAVRVIFRDGDLPTLVTSSAAVGTVVRVGDGVGASVESRVPMMLMRRAGDRAVFAVAIEPVGEKKEGVVRDVEAREEGEGLRIKVMLREGVDEIFLRADGSCEIKPGKGEVVNAGVWRGR